MISWKQRCFNENSGLFITAFDIKFIKNQNKHLVRGGKH